MTTTRYVLLVSIAYAATFLAISFILESWPPYPMYEDAPMLVGSAIALVWLATVRGREIVGADRGEFTAVSALHAAILTILIGGALYIRLVPGV
jgi:hypothetical protein